MENTNLFFVKTLFQWSVNRRSICQTYLRSDQNPGIVEQGIEAVTKTMVICYISGDEILRSYIRTKISDYKNP